MEKEVKITASKQRISFHDFAVLSLELSFGALHKIFFLNIIISSSISIIQI